MSLSRFFLCAVPASAWDPGISGTTTGVDIARFVTDALGCERRIEKGVNLADEYSRYTLCCQRLEQEVILRGQPRLISHERELDAAVRAGQIPMLEVDPAYLSLLAESADESKPTRLGSTFIPPEQVGAHHAAFTEWAKQSGRIDHPSVRQRLAFFQAAERVKCGVVEIQSGFYSSLATGSETASIMAPTVKEPGRFVTIPEFVSDGVAVEFFGTHGSKQRLATVLRKQILEALRTGEPANFGSQASHDVITEVLNEFVFVPVGQAIQPVEMRVVYADGSESATFPLFCLPKSEAISEALVNNDVAPLRAAMMSMRHLELDPEIDFCWFRNYDVSRTRTLAETDQVCYEATLRQLQDSLTTGDLILHLYHTGFEPAILGFYRGLVKTLLNFRPQVASRRLNVVPFYYRGGKSYQAGSMWC
jgi:hypothetical protein